MVVPPPDDRLASDGARRGLSAATALRERAPPASKWVLGCCGPVGERKELLLEEVDDWRLVTRRPETAWSEAACVGEKAAREGLLL